MNPEKPIRIDLTDRCNDYSRDIATCIDVYVESKTGCTVESFVKYRRIDREYSVYIYCPDDKRQAIISLMKNQGSDGLIREIKEPVTYGKIGYPIKPKKAKKTTMSMRYYDKMKEWFTIEMNKYESSMPFLNNPVFRKNEYELKRILERMNITDVKKVI